MKILVIQLARLGDIYQTWPSLAALKRQQPEAEIHCLVRRRFAAALTGLDNVAPILMETQSLLEPVFKEEDGTPESIARVSNWLSELAEQKFDRIINLSFSPASSYLVDAISAENTQVSGYTRYSDGYLSIPDDPSAYFYAQVGIERQNRYHLTDIFAAVCGVELRESDYHILASRESPKSGIVVHLGASQGEKVYPVEHWVRLIHMINERTREPITLIGAGNEIGLAQSVAEELTSGQIINRVGQTQLSEIFTLLQKSKLLIGADSAPVHMATLTKTKALNLSCAAVRFWETGPKTPGSRILFAEEMADISPRRVADEVEAMLLNDRPNSPCFECVDSSGTYQSHGIETSDFVWNLILALYTGSEYPKLALRESDAGFRKLGEIAEMAVHQLDQWSDDKAQTQIKWMATVDELILQLEALDTRLAVIISWFNTERVRIPPDTSQKTLERTRKAFHDLWLVTQVYCQPQDIGQTLSSARDWIQTCGPRLRDCERGVMANEFQTILYYIQELARHGGLIPNRPWSSWIQELTNSVQRSDFIALADTLEFELDPVLARMSDMLS